MSPRVSRWVRLVGPARPTRPLRQPADTPLRREGFELAWTLLRPPWEPIHLSEQSTPFPGVSPRQGATAQPHIWFLEAVGIDLAGLHHQLNMAHGVGQNADVLKWVAIHDQQVGIRTRLDRADLAFHLEQPRSGNGGGFDDVRR